MHTARTLYYSWSLALAASISPPRRDVIPVHHIVPSSDLEYYESWHDMTWHLPSSHILSHSLSLLCNSSSYSSSELEEFFHATEVLNSNHRQYSIDALNATQHSTSKSDHEKSDERNVLIPSDPSESKDPTSNPHHGPCLINSKGGSKTSSIACKSSSSNDMSSKVTTTTTTAHTLNTESGSGIALGNSNAHSSSSSSQNAKNIHLNPFYELSRMTPADLRNYRYNSGLEEDDGW